MESTGSIENLWTKVVFRGKMCGKDFYVMNNFGIAHFSLYVTGAWKYIFKAIVLIHAAFINKTDVFVFKFYLKNSIPLILYLSHIFTFNTILEIMSRTIFFKINVYFFWRSHFALTAIMLYIDKKLMKRQLIWRIICWNRWWNVENIAISWHPRYNKNWKKYYHDRKTICEWFN